MAMKEIELPFVVKRPILACGADLKGAFAVAKGKIACLFDGFGDLADIDGFARYEKMLAREVRKLRAPIIVCDLHPGYFSARCAENLQCSVRGSKLCKVQHHEAHIASAMVDHGIGGNVIGVAFDGTGFGLDGAVWGGEFFAGNLREFKRAAHFAYMPMPGAEAAVKEPWRMAAAYLHSAFGAGSRGFCMDFMRGIAPNRWREVTGMIDKGINSPLTSSAGRLFDAVGSIVMSKYAVKREAEIPVALEALASRSWADHYDFEIKKDGDAVIIDVMRMIRGIVTDLSKKTGASIISGKFHNTIAEIIVRVSMSLRKKYNTDRVILSGGVFQNRFLSERASHLLGEKNFMVYRHLRVSANDNGIPLGQIAITNSRASSRQGTL